MVNEYFFFVFLVFQILDVRSNGTSFLFALVNLLNHYSNNRTFDPEKMHPAIPYVHTDNSEEQPIIRVKIGSGTADLVVDTGAWFDEVNTIEEGNQRMLRAWYSHRMIRRKCE